LVKELNKTLEMFIVRRHIALEKRRIKHGGYGSLVEDQNEIETTIRDTRASTTHGVFRPGPQKIKPNGDSRRVIAGTA
jgi:hypothetical protein